VKLCHAPLPLSVVRPRSGRIGLALPIYLCTAIRTNVIALAQGRKGPCLVAVSCEGADQNLVRGHGPCADG
jgi:hypothetical protein